MGRRRRAAAIASPSRVCAFSRMRSRSTSAWNAARSAAGGRLVMTFPPLVLYVRGFGEPFDHGQAPVPLGGELRHGLGGLVQAIGLYLVENLPALLAPADQPGSLAHD